jgi:hypothetical protein
MSFSPLLALSLVVLQAHAAPQFETGYPLFNTSSNAQSPSPSDRLHDGWLDQLTTTAVVDWIVVVVVVSKYKKRTALSSKV